MDALFRNIVWPEIGQALLDTLLMLGASMLLTLIAGVPLGVLLFLTGPGQAAHSKLLNRTIGAVVNILRSIPFVILLILMIPFTILVMGTSLGVVGAVPPLVVGSAPFYARLVQGALRDIPQATIEAAKAMGATRLQLIFRVLLPEALPSLVSGATVTAIALVSFTAMAGVVGAGGLGDLAIRYGYQRFQSDVMFVTVALLVILVQLIQWFGDWLSRRIDHR